MVFTALRLCVCRSLSSRGQLGGSCVLENAGAREVDARAGRRRGDSDLLKSLLGVLDK